MEVILINADYAPKHLSISSLTLTLLLRKVFIFKQKKIHRIQGLCYPDHGFEQNSSNKRTYGHLKRIEGLLYNTVPLNYLSTSSFFLLKYCFMCTVKLGLRLWILEEPSSVPIWGNPILPPEKMLPSFSGVSRGSWNLFISTPSVVPSKEEQISSKCANEISDCPCLRSTSSLLFKLGKTCLLPPPFLVISIPEPVAQRDNPVSAECAIFVNL